MYLASLLVATAGFTTDNSLSCSKTLEYQCGAFSHAQTALQVAAITQKKAIIELAIKDLDNAKEAIGDLETTILYSVGPTYGLPFAKLLAGGQESAAAVEEGLNKYLASTDICKGAEFFEEDCKKEFEKSLAKAKSAIDVLKPLLATHNLAPLPNAEMPGQFVKLTELLQTERKRYVEEDNTSSKLLPRLQLILRDDCVPDFAKDCSAKMAGQCEAFKETNTVLQVARMTQKKAFLLAGKDLDNAMDAISELKTTILNSVDATYGLPFAKLLAGGQESAATVEEGLNKYLDSEDCKGDELWKENCKEDFEDSLARAKPAIDVLKPLLVTHNLAPLPNAEMPGQFDKLKELLENEQKRLLREEDNTGNAYALVKVILEKECA